ncbi:cyclodeaminase/cyclohydrolase family protein [Halobellus sp. GM3]|uniref:cyclodeaminase/cyclohydrolase family protein n=1 Tax=Halobellus sp. GM3 TaxID=3458410 RepID=UPI00403D7C20
MTYDDESIGVLLDEIASERVTPAGGTAVAIAGAMGAALCEMVCIHTLTADDARAGGPEDGSNGRDTDVGLDPTDATRLRELRADLGRQRDALLALARRDADLVDELFGRDAAPSERLWKRAAGIPLAIAETSLAVLEAAGIAIERGRRGVTADAKTGAYLADAAVQASIATVKTNLETISDASLNASFRERVESLERSAATLRDALLTERDVNP